MAEILLVSGGGGFVVGLVLDLLGTRVGEWEWWIAPLVAAAPGTILCGLLGWRQC